MPLVTEFGPSAWSLFQEGDARINILDGSVRSGKTVASLVKWLVFVKTAPPGEMLMVGKTERTLKRNVFDVLADWLPNPRDFKYVQGTGEVYIAGRRIYYSGANDERSEEKIRGLTLIGVYGDEVSTWPESYFRQAMARLSLPGAKFYGTTNPDSPMHWLNVDYLQREEDLDLKRFKFRLQDNPGLPDDYIEALKREYTGLWYRRYVLGEWSAAEGIIYDMWNPETMVVDLVPEMAEVWLSIDHGTSHATCFLLLGLGVDGRCYILREYFHKGETEGQKSPAEYSLDFRQWLAQTTTYHAIYVDPAAEAFSSQLIADGVKRIRRADNSVRFGIEVVSSLMSLGLLKVHRSCNNLIGEITSYHWDKRAQARGEDKPEKKDDDAVDTLRYGVASRAHIWKSSIGSVLANRKVEEEDDDASAA